MVFSEFSWGAKKARSGISGVGYSLQMKKIGKELGWRHFIVNLQA
jgi:hypothetical protein